MMRFVRFHFSAKLIRFASHVIVVFAVGTQSPVNVLSDVEMEERS